MNRYSQFDVQSKGAIINNGRTASATSLAGWVPANPFLLAAPARVIVNQVHSSSPSQLNGYVEIAGKKAELIIANPSGIRCDGCGFIHATRTELATGSALVTDGVLKGYAMGNGVLEISGKGLDGSRPDAVSILTQAARINAGIWANELQLRLEDASQGMDQSSGQTAAAAPTGIALDVAALGGMYAHKIFLIGTAHGLGVRNNGTLSADDTLVLTIDGRLENRGVIDAAKIKLAATDVANLSSGRIFADTLSISADRLSNTGDTDAAPVIAAATRVDIGVHEFENSEHALLFSGGDMSIGGSLTDCGCATGSAALVTNRAARIEATGKLSLNSQTLLNINKGVTTEEHQVGESTDLSYLQPAGSSEKTPLEYFRWQNWSRAGQYRWKTDATQLSDGVPGKTPLPDVDSIDCTGAGMNEVCTPTPGSSYLRNDPAWAYFKLPPPEERPAAPGEKPVAPLIVLAPPPLAGSDPDGSLMAAWQQQKIIFDQAWSQYQTQQTQYETAIKAFSDWEATSSLRREALNDAITSYNAGFSNTVIRNWTQYKVKHTEFETRVVDSDPAQIIAGSDMVLSGEYLTNDKSQIMAGGRLTGTLENLSNIDVEGTHRIHESGTSQYSKSHYHGWLLNYSSRDWGPLLPYSPADEITSLRLPVTITKDHATDALPAAPIDVAISRLTSEGNRLFSIQPGSGPLFASDARFTQYQQWLSSDAMLAQLKWDPAFTQKRLGDGFIEQRLVREQIAQLTGRRFLEGFASDEAEYAQLMDSGLQQSAALQLRPGIALSAEQIAQLTSDLVWLVEENISLPAKAGQPAMTVKALVPKVYLLPRAGDVQADGSLISAQEVDLLVSQTLNNSALITSIKNIHINAGNFVNLGQINAGGSVSVGAVNDLSIDGGSITATNNISLQAEHDLNMRSLTQSSTRTSQSMDGYGSASRKNLDRVASLHVSGQGTVILNAGRDLTLDAADLVHSGQGNINIAAGRDLQLGTINTSNSISGSADHDHANYLREASSSDIGTRIQAHDDIYLAAGRDLHATAATVNNSTGILALSAEGNIQLSSGEAKTEFAQSTHFSDSSLLGSTSSTERNESSSVNTIASSLSGERVILISRNNITVHGSDIVSDLGTQLYAGDNLSIEAANNTSSSLHYRQDKQSGLMSSGGIGFTVGTRSERSNSETAQHTAVASRIGSVSGDVNLQANQALRQTGSQILAPQGNISLQAKQIDITEAHNTSNSTTDTAFRQTGITLAVSNPVVTAVQTTQKMISAVSDTKDSRIQALALANVGMANMNAFDAVKAGQGSTINGKANQIQTGTDDQGKPITRDANAIDKIGGISIAINAGSSRSDSHAAQSSSEVLSSEVIAGGDIHISARGGDTQSHLTVQGSQIYAGKSLLVEADHDILLQATDNSSEQQQSNHSTSTSLGVVISSNSGMGVSVAASRGQGTTVSRDISRSNTHLQAGESMAVQADEDIQLRGAVLTAPKIDVHAGEQIKIESLQDTNDFEARQKDYGGSLVVGSGVSGNLNLAKSNIVSHYSSVNEQSGLHAGDQGFNVSAEGDTTLTGAVITSTEVAVEKNLNQFSTNGKLKMSDIENKASYSAESFSANLGVGFSAAGKLVPGGTGAGLGKDSDSTSSVTLAGISGMAGNQSARTGDKETGIRKIFDAAKVESEINAQVSITQEFSWRANQAVGDYISAQRGALQQQLKESHAEEDRTALQTQLTELRREEQVLNILIGAVTGFAGAAVTKEALSAAAEKMREYMIEDSKKFAGVTDGQTTLSNVSGTSEGIRKDGFKLGGTRVDLDVVCGLKNTQCLTTNSNGEEIFQLNPSGLIQFEIKSPDMTLEKFLATEEGKKMSGLTGGIQGAKGTLFGIPYMEGSWQDKLIEAFAGTHDMIGGKISGLYDEQGNIKRGISNIERKAYDLWADIAVVPSAPFAAAEQLSAPTWQAISIFLRGAQ